MLQIPVTDIQNLHPFAAKNCFVIHKVIGNVKKPLIVIQLWNKLQYINSNDVCVFNAHSVNLKKCIPTTLKYREKTNSRVPVSIVSFTVKGWTSMYIEDKLIYQLLVLYLLGKPTQCHPHPQSVFYVLLIHVICWSGNVPPAHTHATPVVEHFYP